MAVVNIDNHKISFSDQYFFDTNIWLLLFGTVANFQIKEQKIYSALFADILQRNNSIYSTSLVFSEFSNVLLRRDFNQWKESNNFYGKDFKRDFVGTADYKNSVNSIKLLLNKILALPNLIRVGDSFHNLDFTNIYQDFENIDFNDSYFTEVCRLNNYKMVSNDGDLKTVAQKIDVITIV